LAVDFQVVFPQQIIPLNSVTILRGMNPRSLDILGEDFSAVDEILINDIPSPDVVILSKTRLLAQVPPTLKYVTVTSVTAISRELTISPKSVIKFRVGHVASKVSGILRLVQVFLKLLLTTPGRDIFAPRLGGNVLKDIGTTFGKDESGGIVSDIILAVDRTRRQIITIQGQDPSIPRDERLLAATVTSAAYNKVEAALVVAIELTSHAGRAATANIMV